MRQTKSASDYANAIAGMLGWRKVGYQPETRYYTSGTKTWVTEKVFSGPLDRMRSGTQKVSAWQGIGAYMTERSTGTVMTGTFNPTPNQATPFRTQRALKSQTPGQYVIAYGQADADTYYATVAAQASQQTVSTMKRLRKIMMGK